MDEDFWDELKAGYHKASSLDEHLGGMAPSESVRSLTDRIREAMGLPLPVEPGVRVRFAGNLGAVLTYDTPPASGSHGTVVTVRTASGNATSLDGLVFVKWDAGPFLPVHREHLRLSSETVSGKFPADFRRRVASIGDLSDFLRVGSADELVHKATKDLWALRKEGGEFVIERLFDETGKPLKV